MNDINYEQLVNSLLTRMQGNGVTTKGVVSSTPTIYYGHGPAGLFSYPGISRPVFNAMILPRIGLQSILPVRQSMDENPLYAIFTGVTDTTGDEPTGVCDDPPVAGLSKICTHSQVFARMSRQTRVFDITRMGRLTNRGEFTDLMFQGNPWQAGNPNTPSISGATDMTAVLRNEVNKALFELAVAWSRDFASDIYTGNPVNNTAGGGRKYFYGLDILINTGRRDAITGQLCPAADSIVEDFGGEDISNGASNIVRRVTDIWKRLRFNAANMGLDPVKWVIACRWDLFYELSAVWPCAYQTYRCAVTGTNERKVFDPRVLNEMTESMRGDMYNRTGQYLLIDGERVEVVIDDAITETTNPGATFESSMYFVPLTVLGGTPVTYMEHINYEAGPTEAARVFAPDGMYYTSDGGRFLWHKKLPNNYCVQLMAVVEPRVILHTPMIAARLEDIHYTPITHVRDWDVDASYYVDGGKTYYPGTPASFYTPTSTYVPR